MCHSAPHRSVLLSGGTHFLKQPGATAHCREVGCAGRHTRAAPGGAAITAGIQIMSALPRLSRIIQLLSEHLQPVLMGKENRQLSADEKVTVVVTVPSWTCLSHQMKRLERPLLWNSSLNMDKCQTLANLQHLQFSITSLLTLDSNLPLTFKKKKKR